ncbi:MAG: tyrosine-type recombinase/integrase [Blastocatellia bacterium]|nr:tyrosine-type recombinase/integrase [Blastocatellia bacterium]
MRKHLTESEIDAFLKAARKTRNGVRNHCMALMAYRHGLRVSELTDMRLDQVDLSNSQFQPARLKNGTNVTQPIEGDELRAIRAWMRERSTHKLAGSPLLFLSNQGPMTRQAVNYLFEAIGKKAGIAVKVHPHMFRHSCGFALANRNVATRTIQDYLGHKNIKHTEVYTEANPARLKDVWRNK